MAQLNGEVAIVGGGLSGIGSLAVAPDSIGVSTLLIDRSAAALDPAAIDDARTTAISYTSRRMLEALDLWPAEAAAPILDIHVTDGPSRLFLHFDHRAAGDQPMGHLIENRFLRQRFLDRLHAARHVQVVSGHAIEALRRDDDGVTFTLNDGAHGQARLIIGADGARSWLRKTAGIRTSGWSYRQTAMVCTVRHPLPHHHVAHERFLPGGPFAVLPLTGERSSIVWSERDDLASVMMRLDDRDFAAEMNRRFGHSRGAFEMDGPRASYPLSLTFAHDITATRLALVGDAAHSMHPIAGQAFNLGLRDIAAKLGRDYRRRGAARLDLGTAGDLARYRRLRRADIAALLAATDGLTWLFSNDIPPVRLARDLGLGLVNRMPRLKTMFMRRAMGTGQSGPRLLRGQPL